MSMKLQVNVKEVSYGFVEIDVPDGAGDDEVYAAAEEAYSQGLVNWGDEQFEVTGQEVLGD